MMPFMGVRISWLMLARNSLLARLAASAASLACANCRVGPRQLGRALLDADLPVRRWACATASSACFALGHVVDQPGEHPPPADDRTR